MPIPKSIELSSAAAADLVSTTSYAKPRKFIVYLRLSVSKETEINPALPPPPPASAVLRW
jgi:hypothetical protein